MSYFKNILVFIKKSKLNYLLKKYPESIRNSSEYNILRESMNIHMSNCDKFVNFLEKNLQADQRVDYFYDDFEKYSHIEDFNFAKKTNYDLVFSLGGDGTFLRSLNFNNSNNQLVIGLNTDAKLSRGFYCSLDLNNNFSDAIKKILDNKSEFRYLNKLNISIEQSLNLHNTPANEANEHITSNGHSHSLEKASSEKSKRTYNFINDLYYGEKFMGRISKYQLALEEVNKYYSLTSSGLIVSTCNKKIIIKQNKNL